MASSNNFLFRLHEKSSFEKTRVLQCFVGTILRNYKKLLSREDN